MKILLTGASGFVGSHILDSLRHRGLSTVLLLRPESSRRFISPHLSAVELRVGSIGDPASLQRAMAGVTHVIHCAGATRACGTVGFYEANQAGTRNIVDAVNGSQGQVQRLVYISSLAAAGPARPEKPAREQDTPQPVSEYGKSKLAGEMEVRTRCQAEHVILRPPAVYGPRDVEFLRLFQAVKHHLLVRIGGGQCLSLVFVRDLAEAVVTCLEHPAAAGRTYFVAGREVVNARGMAEEVAAQMKGWTVPLPVPLGLIWVMCFARELMSRLTGKANILSLQKFAELRALGWVCDPAMLGREIGCVCPTTFKAGVAETLTWYRQQHWL